MAINWNLKSVLVQRFGSQVEAALQMGVRESRLSYIVRGHTVPTTRERAALELALGPATVKKLLKSSPRSKSNKEVNVNVR